MTAATLSRSAHSGADELPPLVGGWTLTRVAAGWWLSESGHDVPAAVCSLLPEPGRPSLVIDAGGPDQRTDAMLRELYGALCSAGISAVRLVLPEAANWYARDDSRLPGLDLVAPDGPVVITPHGYGVVRGARPAAGDDLPKWWRRLPDGECVPAGVLAPAPAWERGAAAILGAEIGTALLLRRVPAGLAVARSGRERWLASAFEVWPDFERPTLVIDGTLPPEAIRGDLAVLLARMSSFAEDGVRLYWPRAGAVSGPLLQELARQAGVDLIAPAGDVAISEFGGMSRGPAGAAPWLRFGSDGGVIVQGSLYPEPAWERALAGNAMTGLPADLVIEDVAAGLCVSWTDTSQRGLSATARSILPDPARVTIVAGGDASAWTVRQDVSAVVGHLPAEAARSVRLLLGGAAAGGEVSFAQALADSFGCEVVAPAGKWTATPDGRLRALPAGGWCTFGPRLTPQAALPEPEEPEVVADAVPEAPVEPEVPVAEVVPVAEEAEEAEEADPSPVQVVPREHRSTPGERQAYRDSAGEFHSHSVLVRRMMTQRPGLRSAAAGDLLEATATDFAAVIDFLSNDRRPVAAGLRSGKLAGSPLVACALSGLRRLPSFAGVVISSADLPSGDAAAYVPGSVLTEPAFVEASSSPLAALTGGVEYLIWSQTGKRVAALMAGAGQSEVMLAAGTSYRVLRVDPLDAGTASARVFLREVAASAGDCLDQADQKVLGRLSQAAELRDRVTTDQPPWTPGAAVPIGLDARGVPWRLRTLP